MNKSIVIVTSVFLIFSCIQNASAKARNIFDDDIEIESKRIQTCTEEINKLYNMDNFDWNEKEWKNPKAFQDYLDRAFNNPVDPEFKKNCLKEFIGRNDIVYDKEKDHMTWKRVCNTFTPCKE